MRQTHTDVDDALAAMWALRSALLEASEMDLATEPVPLHGVDSRLDLLNLAGYLQQLVARATACAQDDGALTDRVLEHLTRVAHYGRSASASTAVG
jgi:hypothetical protein